MKIKFVLFWISISTVAREPLFPISLAPLCREWEFFRNELCKDVISHAKNDQYMRCCPCISMDKRVAFSCEVIRELMIRHSSDTELTYISFASGGLLQDYIIISGLIKMGYTKLNINCIDLFYENTETTQRILDEFLKKLNKNIKKSQLKIKPQITFKTYPSANSYFKLQTRKPDIILFADPDMNKFNTIGNYQDAMLLNFDDAMSKVLVRPYRKPVWFIEENADHHNTQTISNIFHTAHSVETCINKLNTVQIRYSLRQHQFLYFDEFLHNEHFAETNSLIAILHHSFETASSKQSHAAQAYLMTRQDYLQYDYILQALQIPGFKQCTDIN